VVGLVAAPALAATLTARAAAAPAPALDVSAHAYLFDHDLRDHDGGSAAVAHGDVAFSEGRLGGSDGAVAFDGHGDVALPDDALGYGGADFALDVWLRTTGAGGTVLDTRHCGDGGGFAVALDGGRLRLLTGGNDDDGTAPGRGGGEPDGAPGPTRENGAAGTRADDGRWHDVSVVRSGAVLRLMLDGVAQQARTLSAVDALGGGATLGRARCGGDGEHGGEAGDDGFRGELDDLTCAPAPPAALPETPFAALLPASAVSLGAIAVVARRRRRTR